VGFTPTIFRTDPTAQTVGPLFSVGSGAGSTQGAMVSHPDGGLYMTKYTSGQSGVLRVDPVTGTATTLIPQQPVWSYLALAVVRGFSGCPTETRKSTWGGVKARYR